MQNVSPAIRWDVDGEKEDTVGIRMTKPWS
jgi:hypothetical protein